jgi:hypothetical protein
MISNFFMGKFPELLGSTGSHTHMISVTLLWPAGMYVYIYNTIIINTFIISVKFSFKNFRYLLLDSESK